MMNLQSQDNSLPQLTNYIFELGTLGSIDRSGWARIGERNTENVAEHTAKATQIGIILGYLEGLSEQDVGRVAIMLAFHETGETRLYDLNPITGRYLDKKAIELSAVKEQLGELSAFGQIILSYYLEFEEQKTKVSLIARDADLLAMAFQAKTYLEAGNILAKEHFEYVERKLTTDSAKNIYNELRETSTSQWWITLSKKPKP